jgi:hypothetical protein
MNFAVVRIVPALPLKTDWLLPDRADSRGPEVATLLPSFRTETVGSCLDSRGGLLAEKSSIKPRENDPTTCRFTVLCPLERWAAVACTIAPRRSSKHLGPDSKILSDWPIRQPRTSPDLHCPMGRRRTCLHLPAKLTGLANLGPCRSYGFPFPDQSTI